MNRSIAIAIAIVFFASCSSRTATTPDGGADQAGQGGAGDTGGRIGTGGLGGAGGRDGTGGAGGRDGTGGLGGQPGSGGRGAGGTGSGGRGAGGGGTGAGGTTITPCPATQPQNGSSCAGVTWAAARCTWGDDPQPVCRPSGTCSGGVWTINPPPSFCSALPASCPGAMPGFGATCGDTTIKNCLYAPGNTLCSCQPCNCDPVPGPPCIRCPPSAPLGTPVWSCDGAYMLAAPCPPVLPNEGSACDLPSTTGCPGNQCGFNMRCVNGVWRSSTEFTWCPVCASPDTPIATPTGDRPIAELRVGDLVYSATGSAIRPVPIIRASRTPVSHHQVVRVTMADGRTLEISAGHPTADGHLFRDLRAGGTLDGQRIESVAVVPYRHAETYDILPASDSGTYFAAGLLIGSTLAR